MINLLFHFGRLLVHLYGDSGFVEDFLKSSALLNGFDSNSSITYCFNQVALDGIVLIIVFTFLGDFSYPSKVFGK